METEQVRLCEIVVGEYRVLLRMEGNLTLPVAYPKIASFYRQLFQNTLSWGKEVLGKELCREYAALPDPRQKSRFPTTRALFRNQLLYDDGEYAVILSTADWSGKKEGLFQYAGAWLLQKEILLLPNEVKKHEKLREYAAIFGEKSEKNIVKKLAN
ncbi:MAG: hypothetical protein IJR88_04890 [Clostridia bacterium]|nr:hypothetical protein [Clostridia bacterium]